MSYFLLCIVRGSGLRDDGCGMPAVARCDWLDRFPPERQQRNNLCRQGGSRIYICWLLIVASNPYFTFSETTTNTLSIFVLTSTDSAYLLNVTQQVSLGAETISWFSVRFCESSVRTLLDFSI